MSESPNKADFAPADPSDGRQLGEWRSKYSEPDAKRAITFEASYLGAHLFLVPVLILILWSGYPSKLFHLSPAQYSPILKYGLAWLSGTLGGTLFDLKWLYHTVARQLWNMDRRLWRLFTPHISGGLAFFILTLVSSGMLRIFDQHAVESHSLVVGISCLVGYFSDSAVAKLTEIAQTLFGVTRGKEEHTPKRKLSARTPPRLQKAKRIRIRSDEDKSPSNEDTLDPSDVESAD